MIYRFIFFTGLWDGSFSIIYSLFLVFFLTRVIFHGQLVHVLYIYIHRGGKEEEEEEEKEKKKKKKKKKKYE